MPEGFVFDQPVDVWGPSKVVELPVNGVFRGWRHDRVVARLRSGATIAQAMAELEVVAERLAHEFPATNRGWTVTMESLHDSIVGHFGRASWLLLAAVAVVLLVACLNVGGLLAARAVARQRETAVRVALGAGVWRLLRLWLAEASLLGAAGAALGLWLAWYGVSALKAAAPPGIPRLDAIALDWPVVAVAVGCAVIAVVISTVAPLGSGRTRDLPHGLRSGSTGAADGPARSAMRHVLTTTQCGGAVVLIVLAVMLGRSFVSLTAVDLGWEAHGVLSVSVQPPMPPGLLRPWVRWVEWSDRLIERLEATPGIQRAAITNQVPLSPGSIRPPSRGAVARRLATVHGGRA